MNYEQKYKEALERAKKHHDNPNASNVRKEWIEDIFPELRESEDERIRKEIIQSIQDNMCVIHKDKCLAWLEKQCEQKPADKVEPKFKVGDWFTNSIETVQSAITLNECGTWVDEHFQKDDC